MLSREVLEAPQAAEFLQIPVVSLRAFVDKGFLPELETADHCRCYRVSDLVAAKRQLVESGFYILRQGAKVPSARLAA